MVKSWLELITRGDANELDNLKGKLMLPSSCRMYLYGCYYLFAIVDPFEVKLYSVVLINPVVPIDVFKGRGNTVVNDL